MPDVPLRLLLLEDNPGDRRLVLAKLADAAAGQFVVTTAERLAQALERLQAEVFDVMLSDLTLPDSERLATVQTLIHHAPNLPLVVLTGSNDDALGKEAILQGAQDYLLKNEASGALIARTLCFAVERKRFETGLRQANATLEGQVTARTAELAASLASAQMLVQDKEALLREVHHRVKNNLQVITSLLRLESRRRTQSETKAVLDEMQGRIRSMALLHESLYRSNTFASVDLAAYLENLATQAFRFMASAHCVVQRHLSLTSVAIGMDQAIACGLLVNELIANCFKHAFPDGRSGEISLELQPTADAAQWQLRVSDNGVGLPADFESRRSGSLGLQLVSDLAKQLGGSLTINPPGTEGATFTLIFHPQEPAALVLH